MGEDAGILGFLGNEDEKLIIHRVSHHRPRGKGSGKRGQQELGNMYNNSFLNVRG